MKTLDWMMHMTDNRKYTKINRNWHWIENMKNRTCLETTQLTRKAHDANLKLQITHYHKDLVQEITHQNSWKL